MIVCPFNDSIHVPSGFYFPEALENLLQINQISEYHRANLIDQCYCGMALCGYELESEEKPVMGDHNGTMLGLMTIQS